MVAASRRDPSLAVLIVNPDLTLDLQTDPAPSS